MTVGFLLHLSIQFPRVQSFYSRFFFFQSKVDVTLQNGLAFVANYLL